MNLLQVVEVLPPLVYLRRGELVVQFAGPADLVGRVAELSSVLTLLDQESSRTGDARGRAKQLPRVPGSVGGRGQLEPESGTVGDGAAESRS
jgi:hypothetical protein